MRTPVAQQQELYDRQSLHWNITPHLLQLIPNFLMTSCLWEVIVIAQVCCISSATGGAHRLQTVVAKHKYFDWLC